MILVLTLELHDLVRMIMRGSASLDQSTRTRRNGGRDILVLLEGPGLFAGLSFAMVRERSRVSICGRLRTFDA